MSRKTEIIAFCSGKGGAGKTLFASCLGFALTRSGLRVLMIDGDPATDGLSLFLLGPKGMQQIERFYPENTFTGVLRAFQASGTLSVVPRHIHRGGESDHGVSYEALISGRGLYGQVPPPSDRSAVPDLDQETFRAGISRLFDQLRTSGTYDYVLVDTRGGFAFESTDVCALADSFLVVTEADYTSFFQDRNLLRRIGDAASELESRSILRAVIVNKAVDGIPERGPLELNQVERSFRLELTKEFPVKFDDTYPVPADVNVLHSYKSQRIPLLAYPASPFSFSTISAFSDVLGVVTSQWTLDQAAKWNELVNTISLEIQKAREATELRIEEAEERARELTQLRDEVSRNQETIALLKRDSERIERVYEREISRGSIQEESHPTASREFGGPFLTAIAGVVVAIATMLYSTYRGRQAQLRTEAAAKQAEIALSESRAVAANNQKLSSEVRMAQEQATASVDTAGGPQGQADRLSSDSASMPPDFRVYIQIGHEEQRARAARLRDALRVAGFITPDIEVVQHPTNNTYVRYFNVASRRKAMLVSRVMEKLDFKASIQNFSKIQTDNPNALEVWIGDFEPSTTDPSSTKRVPVY